MILALQLALYEISVQNKGYTVVAAVTAVAAVAAVTAVAVAAETLADAATTTETNMESKQLHPCKSQTHTVRLAFITSNSLMTTLLS